MTWAALLGLLVQVKPYLWPVCSGVLVLVLRSRSPREWVELGERAPRAQGLVRFLRGAGLDPVKAVAGLRQFVTGRAPPGVVAWVEYVEPGPGGACPHCGRAMLPKPQGDAPEGERPEVER